MALGKEGNGEWRPPAPADVTGGLVAAISRLLRMARLRTKSPWLQRRPRPRPGPLPRPVSGLQAVLPPVVPSSSILSFFFFILNLRRWRWTRANSKRCVSVTPYHAMWGLGGINICCLLRASGEAVSILTLVTWIAKEQLYHYTNAQHLFLDRCYLYITLQSFVLAHH